MFENEEFLYELFISNGPDKGEREKACCDIPEGAWQQTRELLKDDDSTGRQADHMALLGYN